MGIKNYRRTCPTKVDRIAARASRIFKMDFWASYNDWDHCMAIYWRKEV